MMLGLMMLLLDYLGLDRLRCRSLGRGSRHGETRGQGENCSYCQGDDLFSWSQSLLGDGAVLHDFILRLGSANFRV